MKKINTAALVLLVFFCMFCHFGTQEILHYDDVKWPSWRFELLASRVFVQQFVETDNKETSKVCVTVPLWREYTCHRWIPCKKRKMFAGFWYRHNIPGGRQIPVHNVKVIPLLRFHQKSLIISPAKKIEKKLKIQKSRSSFFSED